MIFFAPLMRRFGRAQESVSVFCCLETSVHLLPGRIPPLYAIRARRRRKAGWFKWMRLILLACLIGFIQNQDFQSQSTH